MTLKAQALLSAHSWSAAAVLLLTFACSESNEGAGADTKELGKDASAPAENGGSGGNPANSVEPTPSGSAPNSESSATAATAEPPTAEPAASDAENEPPEGASDSVNPEPEDSSEGGENAEPGASDGTEPADSAGPTDSAGPIDSGEPSEPTGSSEPTETSEPVLEEPSVGCSAGASPPVGAQTLSVDGTERSYIVSLPEGYDPTVPYPLVFAFHGLGGSAELVSGKYYFGLEEHGGKPTVFVYPDGLDTGDGAGWANTDGQDVAFFDALLSTMQQTYCIDSARVFSTGHSYGGIMSHTLGCQRADVLRAIAPVAGAFFGGGGAECSGPVAAWGAHGNPDNTVDYENGLSAIERVLETNGCDPDSATPVEPTEFCVRYECDSDYPVTWCTHGEDHNWPDFASESIKAFFDSF
jgi:polyhydroxybutyrate depolymerase